MTEVKAGRSRAWLAGLAGAAALAALAAPIAGANAQMQDDTIRFATQSISPGLGRPEFGTASPGVYTLWPIYESMTRVSPQGDVSGLLAVSWEEHRQGYLAVYPTGRRDLPKRQALHR